VAKGDLGPGAGGAGFVRERGVVHPREVDTQFAQGKTRNWFGGSSNASTQLLDGMHYRGLLRVVRRDSGTRVYAVREAAAHDIDPEHAHDALLDVVLATYAPLPERSLSELASHLVLGAPQWRDRRRDALQRLLGRACQAQVDGLRWIWPAGENPASRRHRIDDRLRLLAPFDPVVWDRRRFELFWGWAYRFEAYTPAHKRVRGHYALPLLWQGRVDGWGNLSVEHGRLQARHRLACRAAAGRPGLAHRTGRRTLTLRALPGAGRRRFRLAHAGGLTGQTGQAWRAASSACATSAKPWPRSPAVIHAGQCVSSAAKRSRLATPTLCGSWRNITWSFVLSPT
jgi:uncharacterized protein YcaQ